jgi:hypothetical protein
MSSKRRGPLVPTRRQLSNHHAGANEARRVDAGSSCFARFGNTVGLYASIVGESYIVLLGE